MLQIPPQNEPQVTPNRTQDLAQEKLKNAEKQFENELTSLNKGLKSSDISVNKVDSEIPQYEINFKSENSSHSLWLRFGAPTVDNNTKIGDVGIAVSYSLMLSERDGMSLRDLSSLSMNNDKSEWHEPAFDKIFQAAAGATSVPDKIIGKHPISNYIFEGLHSIKMPPPPNYDNLLCFDSSELEGPEYFGDPNVGRLNSMLEKCSEWLNNNPNADTKSKVQTIHKVIFKTFGTYAPELKELYLERYSIRREIKEIETQGITLENRTLKENQFLELITHLETLIKPQEARSKAESEILNPFNFKESNDLSYAEPMVDLLTNLNKEEQNSILIKYKKIREEYASLESDPNSPAFKKVTTKLDAIEEDLSTKLFELRQKESIENVRKLFFPKSIDLNLNSKEVIDRLESLHKLASDINTTEKLKAEIAEIEKKMTSVDSTNTMNNAVGTDSNPADINSTLRPDTLVCKDYAALFTLLSEKFSIPSLYISDEKKNHAFVYLPKEKVILETTQDEFEYCWQEVNKNTKLGIYTDDDNNIHPSLYLENGSIYTFSSYNGKAKIPKNPLYEIIEVVNNNDIDNTLKQKADRDHNKAVTRIQNAQRVELTDILRKAISKE